MPKKSSIEKLLDNYLQGLILPEEPSSLGLVAWLLIALTLVLLAVFIGKRIKIRNHRRQLALRKLKKLSINTQKKTEQATALALSSILREGLNVPRLSAFKTPKVDNWENFISEINSACYSKNVTSQKTMRTLIKESQRWLLDS